MPLKGQKTGEWSREKLQEMEIYKRQNNLGYADVARHFNVGVGAYAGARYAEIKRGGKIRIDKHLLEKKVETPAQPVVAVKMKKKYKAKTKAPKIVELQLADPQPEVTSRPMAVALLYNPQQMRDFMVTLFK